MACANPLMAPDTGGEIIRHRRAKKGQNACYPELNMESVTSSFLPAPRGIQRASFIYCNLVFDSPKSSKGGNLRDFYGSVKRDSGVF